MTNKDELAITTVNALMLMDEAKARLDAFLQTLTDKQKNAPSVAADWAVRDHLKHLAVWHESLLAILKGEDRWEAIDFKTSWIKRGVTTFDDINAIIYYQHRHLDYAESVALFEETFQQVRDAVSQLSDDDLQKPFNHFSPTEAHRTDPIIGWIDGVTFGHYEEHLPWMITRADHDVQNGRVTINHVAVVVPSIDDALPFWADALGLTLSKRQEVAQEAVEVAFFDVGDSHIELVQPLTEDSGIAKFLTTNGSGIHHLCLEVDDIQHALNTLQKKGITLINDTPKEREGRKYAFIHPKSTGGVLVELYERVNA